jgi:uncharacterized iron-regulated protein
MKGIALLLVSILLSISLVGQGLAAYKIYNSKGKEVTFNDLIKSFSKKDVILIGEQHNDPIAHWMQLEITKAIHSQNQYLVLGAEMFEADDQVVMDEYLSGVIRHKDFQKEAKVWPNYETDYKPLVEFANENKLPFIATNIPRRYASMIVRTGFEGIKSLNDHQKSLLPEFPIPFDTAAPGYSEMMSMMGGAHGHGGGDRMLNMVKAQASKDATMAHRIAQALTEKGKKAQFIHYQGDYHSANKGGIYWYLNEYAPKLKVGVMSTVVGKDAEWKSEFENRADYILVVDEDMTKTH